MQTAIQEMKNLFMNELLLTSPCALVDDLAIIHEMSLETAINVLLGLLLYLFI